MRHGHAARIANISGVAHATPAAKSLARKLGHRETRLINPIGLLDEIVAVDGLARLLTRGIELHTSADGRLDVRGIAAHVLSAMTKGATDKSERGVDTLTEVIKRGIDVSLKDGRLETTDLAAFVLRTMKG